MRLTVHVAEAKKESVEVPVKGKPGAFMNQKKTFTTLSFRDVNPLDVDRILKEVQADGHGVPVKHYLSGEKIPGHSSGKKK